MGVSGGTLGSATECRAGLGQVWDQRCDRAVQYSETVTRSLCQNMESELDIDLIDPVEAMEALEAIEAMEVLTKQI